MKKRNFVLHGFTLAEVLITLVIIGVIGALTVPSLIQNTQKQEYVSALKKAYSTLSQVTQQIIAEEGSPQGNDSWLQDNESMYNMYKQHLNILKDCGEARGCWDQPVKWTENNSSYGSMYWQGRKYLILANGINLMFDTGANNACPEGNGYHGSKNVCGVMFVDINGEKKPNTYGRDVFAFVLKADGLYPRGCDVQGYCGQGTTGGGCACRVIQENAMNY